MLALDARAVRIGGNPTDKTQAISQVGERDVARVAKRLFRTERAVDVIVGPG